jgi:hypothetical protein
VFLSAAAVSLQAHGESWVHEAQCQALTVDEHAPLDEDGAVVKAEALVVIILGPAAGANQVHPGQEAAEHLHTNKRLHIHK